MDNKIPMRAGRVMKYLIAHCYCYNTYAGRIIKYLIV